MDGECGHTWVVNLCAKPGTKKKKKKKPTNSGVQRALSSAMSKSQGKGLGTSFASSPFFGEVIGHLCLSDRLPG